MIYDLIIQYLQTKYSFILIMPKDGTYAILFKLKNDYSQKNQWAVNKD